MDTRPFHNYLLSLSTRSLAVCTTLIPWGKAGEAAWAVQDGVQLSDGFEVGERGSIREGVGQEGSR